MAFGGDALPAHRRDRLLPRGDDLARLPGRHPAHVRLLVQDHAGRGAQLRVPRAEAREHRGHGHRLRPAQAGGRRLRRPGLRDADAHAAGGERRRADHARLRGRAAGLPLQDPDRTDLAGRCAAHRGTADRLPHGRDPHPAGRDDKSAADGRRRAGARDRGENEGSTARASQRQRLPLHHHAVLARGRPRGHRHRHPLREHDRRARRGRPRVRRGLAAARPARRARGPDRRRDRQGRGLDDHLGDRQGRRRRRHRAAQGRRRRARGDDSLPQARFRHDEEGRAEDGAQDRHRHARQGCRARDRRKGRRRAERLRHRLRLAGHPARPRRRGEPLRDPCGVDAAERGGRSARIPLPRRGVVGRDRLHAGEDRDPFRTLPPRLARRRHALCLGRGHLPHQRRADGFVHVQSPGASQAGGRHVRRHGRLDA